MGKQIRKHTRNRKERGHRRGKEKEREQVTGREDSDKRDGGRKALYLLRTQCPVLIIYVLNLFLEWEYLYTSSKNDVF